MTHPLLLQDKTFGLKNKKGGKAQKFIAQVEKQVKTGGDPRLQKLEAERAAEKKKKEDEKKAEDEKNLLFRPVQKIEAGKQALRSGELGSILEVCPRRRLSKL